jgi:hypothetical protein
MKHFASLTVLLLTASIGLAHADEVRSCDFEVKPRCTSGSASVTLADGAVKSVEVTVVTCGLRGRPGYTCMIDASRGDTESKWSEENGATAIANASPFNPTAPDRVKVTVGKYVSIDMDEAQSLGRCGAGAELPRAIVIPAAKGACKVFLGPR